MAINIGALAIDRATSGGPQFTYVNLDSPAPFNGTIITVELWPHAAITNCKVGSFIRDGAKFTMRDWTLLGNMPGDSKQTYQDLDIDVHNGDCIGIHSDTSSIDLDLEGGVGYAFADGDIFDGNEHTCTLRPTRVISLGGWVQQTAPAPAKRSFGFVIG